MRVSKFDRRICRFLLDGTQRELGVGAPSVRLTLGTVERTTWAASADVAARVTAVEETAATASDTVASYEDLGSEEF